MAHVAHCEFEAVVQVSADRQPRIGAHALQAVWLALRKKPVWHALHIELLGVVQVSAETQDDTGEHATHVPGLPLR